MRSVKRLKLMDSASPSGFSFLPFRLVVSNILSFVEICVKFRDDSDEFCVCSTVSGEKSPWERVSSLKLNGRFTLDRLRKPFFLFRNVSVTYDWNMDPGLKASLQEGLEGIDERFAAVQRWRDESRDARRKVVEKNLKTILSGICPWRLVSFRTRNFDVLDEVADLFGEEALLKFANLEHLDYEPLFVMTDDGSERETEYNGLDDDSFLPNIRRITCAGFMEFDGTYTAEVLGLLSKRPTAEDFVYIWRGQLDHLTFYARIKHRPADLPPIPILHTSYFDVTWTLRTVELSDLFRPVKLVTDGLESSGGEKGWDDVLKTEKFACMLRTMDDTPWVTASDPIFSSPIRFDCVGTMIRTSDVEHAAGWNVPYVGTRCFAVYYDGEEMETISIRKRPKDFFVHRRKFAERDDASTPIATEDLPDHIVAMIANSPTIKEVAEEFEQSVALAIARRENVRFFVSI